MLDALEIKKSRGAFCIALAVVFATVVPCAAGGSSGSTGYKPAVFNDPKRAERVRATAGMVADIYKKFVEKNHIPGLAYGIVLDGKLLFAGGLGYANLEQHTPVDSQSLFRIASISKSFTAVAILQLRDAGKLSLDDPAANYLPQMEQLNYLTKDAPVITVRHLLTHGAGFPEDNPWGDRQLANSDQELLQLLEEGVAFSNVPDRAYEYSNLGYALLGQVVQNVSGMSFAQYTTERILKPLGMKETVWEFDKANKENLALGYKWIDGTHVSVPLAHHGSFAAMGGLITSIEDFIRYAALHLSAWPPRSGPDVGPLKRSSVREMHHPWRLSEFSAGGKCPFVLAYGYGLNWAHECDGLPYLSHNGGLPGFGCNWIMSPELGLAVMSFNNRTYGSTLWVNRSVYKKIIKVAGLNPRVQTASRMLEKRKAALVNILPTWEAARGAGIFSKVFFMNHRIQDLVRQSKELFTEVGNISQVGKVIPENQLRGTFVIEGDKKNLEVYFTLTPEVEPLIQELKMKLVGK